MKEHAKKALKHDTKILGKTVPTMLIIGLFLVGGGSAALLSSFGTVSGEADVQQAIELQSDSKFAFDGAQTAGETLVETRTLQSNANVTTQIGFKTTCEKDQGDSNSIEGNEADFSGDCNGIDTRYVEYFDDAGHDFSNYQSPSVDEVEIVVDADDGSDDGSTPYATIQAAIDASDADQSILVKSGDYGSFTVNKDVTVVAANASDSGSPASVDGRIKVEIDGVTVKGFRVNPQSLDPSSEAEAIFIGNPEGFNDQADERVVIDSTFIESFSFSEGSTAEAIHAKAYSNQIEGLTISNNYIEGVEQTNAGANGMKLQADLKDVDVVDNTVKDIKGAWSYGIGLTYSSGETSYPKSVAIERNLLDVPAPTAGEVGLDDVKANKVAISQNNFVGSGLDLGHYNANQDKFTDGTLVADNNWFGTDGIQKEVTPEEAELEFDGSIEASYKEKSDTSIEAETTDKFGVVNEFAINLAPADYSLTTSISPAGAEETPS